MRKQQKKAKKYLTIRQISNEELFVRLSEFEEFNFLCKSCGKKTFHDLEGRGNNAHLICGNKKCSNKYWLTPISRHFLEEKLRIFLKREFEAQRAEQKTNQ